MSPKTVVLVTGATGRTGVELCTQLAALPDVEVRAAIHTPLKRRLLPDSVAAVPFDSADPASTMAAFRGVHRLFMLSPGGPGAPPATAFMAEAAKASGIDRIVKLSSYDPHSPPQTPTDLWALEGEAAVRDARIPWTLLRPPWFYQNFHNGYFTPMVAHKLLALPFGEGRSGWIDCRDVAAVAVKALLESGHEEKTYTLTGPAAISLPEIASTLSEAMGFEIRYLPLTDEQWIDASRAAGFSDEETFGVLALMNKTRVGGVAGITDDVERVLGRPPISFARYAQAYAEELVALTSDGPLSSLRLPSQRPLSRRFAARQSSPGSTRGPLPFDPH